MRAESLPAKLPQRGKREVHLRPRAAGKAEVEKGVERACGEKRGQARLVGSKKRGGKIPWEKSRDRREGRKKNPR